MTLVGMMVSSAVGATVLGVTIKIYADISATYQLTLEKAQTQQSGRFALIQLKRHLQQAGYCIRQTGMDASTATSCSSEDNFNVIIANEGNNDPDSVMIIYQSAENSTNYNCSGNIIKDGHLIKNLFYVDNNQLKCEGNPKVNNKLQAKNASNSVVLASNIKDFQVYFGIDQDNNGVAECFVDGNFFNKKSNCTNTGITDEQKIELTYDPNNIVSVRVELKFNNDHVHKSTMLLRNNIRNF